MPVGELVEQLLGNDLPVRLKAWDGTVLGPADAPATILLRSQDALRFSAAAIHAPVVQRGP